MRNLTHLAEFEALLNHMVSIGASDMHLSVNTAPVIRLHGLTEPRAELERLTDAILQSYANAILSTEQLATLQQRRSCDLGYTSDQHHRFRINVYYERGSMAFAVRWLDGQFYSYEKLNLPPQIGELVKLKDGLVLVTGATGSGKSTTLATLINEINEKYCWNCCHSYDTQCHTLPLNYDNNIFHMYGEFCSFECVARYIFDTYINHDLWDKYSLLNLYCVVYCS